MFSLLSDLAGKFRIERFCCGLPLLFCLGLLGCSNLGFRGDPYPHDRLTEWAGQYRRSDELFRHSEDSGGAFAASNKAGQIRQNLGGARRTGPYGY